MQEAHYKPLGDYGVIGNTHTAALVGRDGSIDWLCVPRFDSPSVFAAILDAEKGGHFELRPLGYRSSSQRYLTDTNVLVTRFQGPRGAVEVTDFMPCWERDGGIEALPEIHRRVTCLRGSCEMVVDFMPRLDYGRQVGRWCLASREVVVEGEGQRLSLRSPDRVLANVRRAATRFALREGETAVAVLSWGISDAETPPDEVLERTIRFWRNWARRMTYSGPHRDLVARSALTLKLLTYSPSGAIVAAPTTSLPEAIGGGRNWDYRYTWLRDATLTLDALYGLGYDEEAERFVDWIAAVAAREPAADLRVMYRVDGSSDLEETTLDHLEGYRGSRPVRVGNGAATQRQLDVFGEALHCLHFCRTHPYARDRGAWEVFAALADRVASEWWNPDSGIWEMRSAPRQFVHSKAMCWVALDRAYRAGCELGLQAHCERWQVTADEIRAEVLRRGYDEEVGAFVQAFGEPEPDASVLLLPLVGFVDAADPRMVSTVRWLRRTLERSGLLQRYRQIDDGVGGPEGAFAACSFWLVRCLARMGERGEAGRLFERLLTYASPLGLYAEEIDPATGELLGNFPQAFTHIGLISAALDLYGSRREQDIKAPAARREEQERAHGMA